MIFISWTGFGWLFLLIPCVILIVGGFIIDIFKIDMPTFLMHYLMIGLMLSAISCWFLGKKVNKEKIVAYDDETGEPIMAKDMHTLWNIPVQHLPIVFMVLASICFFVILFI